MLEAVSDWEDNGFVFVALALGRAARAEPGWQMPVG